MGFLLIAVVVAIAYVARACDTQSEKVGTCKIKYHVCEHVNSPAPTDQLQVGMKYQCDAIDEADGENYKGDWHDDAKKACEESTYHLFKDLKAYKYNDYPCNCDYQMIDQSTCHLQVAACFYFEEKDDVHKEKVHYRGYAFDADACCQDHEGKSDGYKEPEDAGQAAVNDLFQKYPDTAKKCGQGVEYQSALNAAMANVTSLLEEKMRKALSD